MKRLIDKDALLADLDEAIREFIPKNENDQAFLEGVIAARRIVKFTEEASNGQI